MINLCEDREYWDGEREAVAGACARAGIAEHRLAVIDGATVPPDVLERAIEAAAEGVAYVHCRGGRERSAAVAIAPGAASAGSSVDEALESGASRSGRRSSRLRGRSRASGCGCASAARTVFSSS